MIALYKKELRGLLPLLLLMVLIFGGDFLYRPLAERVDEVTWVEQSGHLLAGEGGDYAFVLMIMALIAAYSLFPREYDEKTIELLYALPIRRRGIFAAKALAAWTVLVAGLVLDHLAGAIFQALNPQSFGGEQWRLDLAIRIVLLDAFFCAAVLLHGILISFLRRFGLLLYAVAAFAVMQVKRFAPGNAYLDPSELLELKYRGSELIVPWPNLLFHAVVALLAGAAAYVLWMGRAEEVNPFWARLQSRLAGRIALGCVPAALIVAGMIWLAVTFGDEDPGAEAELYRAFLPVRAETEWYDVTYAAGSSERARALLREADRAYEAVAAYLGVEDGPRIDADLTDEGGAHLGIAQGGVIRVALATLSAEEALMTLHHETVHALQFELAGWRVGEHMASLRTFVEGSAVYVTAELEPDEPARRAHRRLAAAAFERHRIRFEDLIDDVELRALHDANLVYPLGETWTAALAETCGPAVVGDFFRALGRAAAPEDLSGLPLWQDTLRAAGCQLETAVARWGENMKQFAAAERAFLGALPRLGGGVARVEDGELIFQLQLDREVDTPAETYFLRVRRDAETSEDETYTFTAELEPAAAGIFFRVPEAWIESDTFELQFGQSIPGSLWPFFEDWQAASYDPE